MARRAPNTTTGGGLATRVVYLPDPLATRQPVPRTRAQQLAKRRRDREAYEAWHSRQLALIEHDRRMRRLFLGIGLTVGTGLLVAVGLVGWWVWNAITTATVNIDGGLIAFAVLGLVVVGAKVGHHCVTTITHRH